MADEPVRLTLRLFDEESDDEHLDELARRLRAELMELDIAVDGGPGRSVPLGAKAVEIAALGTLVVTLSQSPVLAALIDAVSAWLGRRRQRSVKLEVDGDVLELSGQTAGDQRALVEAWLRRRAGTGKHALIVANYDYRDPGLSRLRAPAHDAEQLAAVLGDPRVGGFEVVTLLNAAAAEINEAIEDFFADRTPDELLLLHFSGHGVKDEAGELYFAASGTKLNRLGATAVSADFVSRRMNRSRSRRVVLLLDCCYSGAFGRGMVARAGSTIALEEQFGGRGRAIITASSAMEYAFEGQELADSRDGGPSVFTSALVQGLKTGDADRDQDGFVGLDELYDYVYDRVRRTTPHQTPGKWAFDLQGDLRIARRGRPVTTPAALPAELQEAIDHPLTGMRSGAVRELERLLRARHEGIALAARLALERLSGDDSRSVAAAAATALGAKAPTDPPAEAAPTPVEEPSPVEPVTEPRPAPEPVVELPLAPEPVAELPPAAEPVAEPRPVPEPVLPTRHEERPSRWWSAPARALALLGALGLAVAWATDANSVWWRATRGLPTEPTLLWVEPTLLLAAMVAAVVLGLAPRARAEREIARAVALGLPPALLGLFAVVTTDHRPTVDVLLFGISLLVVWSAALVELLPETGHVGTAVNAGCVLVVLAALLIHLASPREVFPDSAAGGLVVLASLAVLVAIGVRRWRERPPTWFGLSATGLLVADGMWAAFDRHLLPTSALFVPAVLLVLLAELVVGERRPTLLAAVRVLVALGLILHQPILVPMDIPVHVLLEFTALALATAGYYATLSKPGATVRPEAGRPVASR